MNLMIYLTSVSLSLFLLACNDSGSTSDKAPSAEAAPTITSSTAVSPSTEGDSTAATGSLTPPASTESELGELPTSELQEVIKLNSAFLEYSRLQYDCGDITAPIDSVSVEAKLKGAQSFQTLAATIPAKDKALVKISAFEDGKACTYRAIFSVNKAFTEVTFANSQSLDGESFTGCFNAKTTIDNGFGEGPIAFEYDKKFIRWVALHIPDTMQVSPVCASGNLRAVFAGATL